MAKGETVGGRVQRLRKARDMSLSELARQAEISKPYLSQIESGETKRPSAEVLYRLASVLGTTVAALLGKSGASEAVPDVHVHPALAEFARKQRLGEEEVRMLAGIRHRGRQPETEDDWRYLYDSIRRSVARPD